MKEVLLKYVRYGHTLSLSIPTFMNLFKETCQRKKAINVKIFMHRYF